LVYAIIVESGGAIDVKSAREQGSTFTIYLPRLGVAPDMAAPGSAMSRSMGQPAGACLSPIRGEYDLDVVGHYALPDVGVQSDARDE
jgi:hypothetical protein